MSRRTIKERAGYLRNVLKQRQMLESISVAEGPESSDIDIRVSPDDVLARLEGVIKRMPEDEVGDRTQFKEALKTLLEYGDPALRKLLIPPGESPPSDLTADELGSVEALIIADGSRPSFLLREGSFAPDHPFLGTWCQDMNNFYPTLQKLAACVGRIQLPDGNSSAYNGTGTLVPAADSAERLVLTNFHVVMHARTKSGVAMEEAPGRKLLVKDEWVIDFVGESGNPKLIRWRVTEVRLPEGSGVSFSGVDAAVLCIEPFGEESKLPEPAIILSSNADYSMGAGNATFVTIGFPGEPNTITPAGAKIDWNFVIKTLFNNRFGFKRVAPGRFLESAGSVSGDTLGHIISHDATTFGGASGSLLFAWKEDDAPAFALHFAGSTLDANYAVSLCKTSEALRRTGMLIR